MTARRAALAVLVSGALGSLAGAGVYAAFTATTASGGNSYGAGTVVISDDDGGTAMLSMPSATAGDGDTSCVVVTYTGSLSASVRLYGTLTGTLPAYLTLTVTRGTIASPAFDSCAGFTADTPDYVGAGPGVIYSGQLSAFPATYTAGIVDPTAASPESWTTNEAHAYRFAVSLGSDPAGQNRTGTAAFTWEARNE